MSPGFLPVHTVETVNVVPGAGEASPSTIFSILVYSAAVWAPDGPATRPTVRPLITTIVDTSATIRRTRISASASACSTSGAR